MVFAIELYFHFLGLYFFAVNCVLGCSSGNSTTFVSISIDIEIIESVPAAIGTIVHDHLTNWLRLLEVNLPPGLIVVVRMRA